MTETSPAPSKKVPAAAPAAWQADSFRRRFWVGLLSLVMAPFVLVLRFMPKSCFGLIALPLSFLYRTVVRRDVRIARRNLAEVLGLSPGAPEGRRMERAVFRHQVRSSMETISAIYRPSRLELTGYDELSERIRLAEDAGRGHLIVTAHLGSWELVGASCARAAQRPFHVLAKRSKVPAATAVLESLRNRFGSEVLWIGSKTLLREMLRALKKAESLGFVMDQKPEGRRGPVVEFFGFPTEFVKGPATLARRTGCAVIAVFCIRTGPLSFHLESETLLESGHEEKNEVDMTQLFAFTIEQAIRRHPEQWSWNYKRWYFDEEPKPLSRDAGTDPEKAAP